MFAARLARDSWRNGLPARFPTLVLLVIPITTVPAFAQPSPPSIKLPDSSTHSSSDVVEHLSPAEAEEGRLNGIYESVARLQRSGACSPELIQRYQSEVIPAAEKSKSNVPKNKFLFLSNRDIGNCYLEQRRFVEAEASFQKILPYAVVWPGVSDSAYPISFRQIATAQMGQEHWAAAEQSLLKSIALFDPVIAAGEKSDAELHAQFSLNCRGSQSRSYASLAVVYFREGRIQDALKTAEKAYNSVSNYNLPPQYRAEVVNTGRQLRMPVAMPPPRSFGLSGSLRSDPVNRANLKPSLKIPGFQ